MTTRRPSRAGRGVYVPPNARRSRSRADQDTPQTTAQGVGAETNTRETSEPTRDHQQTHDGKNSPLDPICDEFERNCSTRSSSGAESAHAPGSTAANPVSPSTKTHAATDGLVAAVQKGVNTELCSQRKLRRAWSQYVPPGRRGGEDQDGCDPNGKGQDDGGVVRRLPGKTPPLGSEVTPGAATVLNSGTQNTNDPSTLRGQHAENAPSYSANQEVEQTMKKNTIPAPGARSQTGRDPDVTPSAYVCEDGPLNGPSAIKKGAVSNAGPVASKRGESYNDGYCDGTATETPKTEDSPTKHSGTQQVEEVSPQATDLHAHGGGKSNISAKDGRTGMAHAAGDEPMLHSTNGEKAESVTMKNTNEEKDALVDNTASGTKHSADAPQGNSKADPATEGGEPTSGSSKSSPTKTASAPYVPPGRRRLMEATPAQDRLTTESGIVDGMKGVGPLWTSRAPVRVSQKARPSDGGTSSPRPAPSRVAAVVSGGMSAYGANIEEYSEQMSRGQVEACTALITNFPAALPPGQREAMLQPFLDKGALVVWPRPDEALATYATPTLARQAISSKSNRSTVLRVELLSNAGEDYRRRLRQVELARPGRPPADVSSASRLISGALGIRQPREQRAEASAVRKGSSAASKTGIRGRGAINSRMKKPEESTDSWDM